MSRSPAAFPDAETLALCERFSLCLRQGGGLPVRGHALRGGLSPGLDFEGHREWVEGLDPRHIDWTLWARHRALYVRTFEDEGAGVLAVLLDASKSMGLGQPSRFALAQRVAAALVYAGLREARGVLLGLARGAVLERHWLTGGADAAGLAYDVLARAEPDGETSLAAAADHLRALPARGDVVVVSDFLDPSGADAVIDRLAALGWHVSALRLLTEDERCAPPPGTGLRDPETLRRVVAPSETSALQHRLDAHHASLRGAVARQGGALVEAMPNERLGVVLERLLSALLRARGARAGA